MQHGHGIEYFSNGDRYEGKYYDGEKHGSGEYHCVTDGIYEKQVYINGKLSLDRWI